jgi:hypothetical protein
MTVPPGHCPSCHCMLLAVCCCRVLSIVLVKVRKEDENDDWNEYSLVMWSNNGGHRPLRQVGSSVRHGGEGTRKARWRRWYDDDNDDNTGKVTPILLYHDRILFAQDLIGTSRLNVQNSKRYYAVCGLMGS